MIRKHPYILLGVFLALLAGAILFIAVAGNREQSHLFEGQLRCESLDSDWERVYYDGRRESVTLPSSLETEDGFIVLETRLPRIEEDGMNLSFYCLQQDAAVYVDDELRTWYVESLVEDVSRMPSGGHLKARNGRPSANIYVFTDLYKKDSRATLRIEYYSSAFYDRNAGEVFIGDQLGIWKHYFDRRIGVVAADITMAAIAAIAMVMMIIYSVRTKHRMSLAYLLTGVLMIGLWKFTDNSVDNPFRQFIFRDNAAVQNASYMMEYFMLVPVLCYLDRLQKGRYHRIYAVVGWIDVVSALMAVVLDASETLYYSQFEPVLILMVGVCILTIFVSLFLDIKKGFAKEYTPVVVSLFFLTLTGVMELVALYDARFRAFTGFVVYGLLVIVVAAILDTCVELSRARAEVTAANRASEEGMRFLSGMSHEIRTPVNTILGMNEMIRRETANEQVMEYSMDISNAGNTLVSLIDDIIDFTRMEAGGFEINEAPYQPSSLFNDVCVLTERSASDKKLEFSLNISPKIPAGLCGDVSRIRQIMLNIVTNAIKYTNEGRVILEVRGNERDGLFIFSFSVTDTGIGIREEDIRDIFEAYSRADESQNARIEGTGLGLAITKRLVDSMHGEIHVDSVYGRGSTFTVRIPQKISDPRPMGEFVRSSVSRIRDRDALAAFRAQGKRILAVDDNMTNLIVFRGLLKRSRMRIDIATSGMEALKMLSENDYDLVFMDHMMPGLDGVETLRELRAETDNRNHDTPVIVLTANVISGAEQMYMSEGFAAYLSKPIAPARLVDVLQKYLTTGAHGGQDQTVAAGIAASEASK